MLRYFSGTGVYKKTIDVNKEEGEEIWLDLGSVEVIAAVLVNGKEIEVEWKPPFLTEITDALKSGTNELEIRVANLWGNRFIGDEQYPDDIGFSSDGLLRTLPKWFEENKPRPQQGRKTFTTNRYYDKDDPLRPSGLLGPVALITGSKHTDPRVEAGVARPVCVQSQSGVSSYGWHSGEAPYFGKKRRSTRNKLTNQQRSMRNRRRKRHPR